MKRKAPDYPPPGHGPPGYGPPPGDYYGPPHAYREAGPPGTYPPPKRPLGPPHGGPPPPYGGPPPMAGPPRRDGPPPGPGGPPGPAGPGPRGEKNKFHVDLPPEPNILQEIFLDRKLVGKIIGPGGETAASIRRQARCFLHVRKETRPDGTQCVEVSGNANQVKAGVDRILEIIKDEAASDPKLAPRLAPDAVTYFDVMPQMIGYILGSKGATVKMLRQKTATEIQVTDAAPETGLQAITIRGAPQGVQEAYVMIRSMLEKYDPRRGKGPPPGLLSTPPMAPPGPSGMRGPMGPGYDGPPHDMPPPHHYHDGPPPYDRGPDYGPDPYYHGPPPGERGYPPPGGYPPHDYPPHGGRDPYGPGPDRGSPGRPGDRYGQRPGPPDPRQPPAAEPSRAQAPAAAAASTAPAAAAALPAGTPQFLVLHADGTYRPAQIILQPGAAAATLSAAGLPTASAAGLSAVQQLLGQVAGASAAAASPVPQQSLAGLPGQSASQAAQPTAYAGYPTATTTAASAYPTAASTYAAQPAATTAYTAQQHAYAQYTQPAAATYPGYDTHAHAHTAAGTATAGAPAAPATTAGSTAAPAGSTPTGALSLQQLQQYYNSYAQMYQQAAQQGHQPQGGGQ